MPSPFPGMDPYLETTDVWSDFHGTLLTRIRARLNRDLPARYFIRWDRYVWLEGSEGAMRGPLARPDVFITEPYPPEGDRPAGVLAAPATVLLPTPEPRGKPYLKIIDVRDRRVVTVIELLSKANKTPGKDRDAYLAKREEYLLAKVNLVELDLLRSGKRPPVEGAMPTADYLLLVGRPADFPRAGVWPVSVRDRLPTFPIPLDPAETPLALSLQTCADETYEEAGFGREIDYTQPPDPPLAEPDAAWARDLLAHGPYNTTP